MRARRSLRRCTFTLVVLSLLAYGVSTGGIGAALFAIALASGGWWLTEGKHGWAAPRWVIATLLVLVIARGLWTLSLRPATSITPFLAFLTSIVVVKCWERRGPRDFAQMLSIAAFVLIGSALGSNSFGTGLIIAVSFPVLVHGAIMLQIEAARAKAEQLGRHAADLGDIPRKGTARFTLGLAMLGVAFAAGVFVVVPRTQGSPGLAALGLAGARVSGFRDRVELGRAGLINMSQVVVMEVEVVTGEGVPNVARPEGELYLRGAVLDTYNHRDGTWSRGVEAMEDVGPQGFPLVNGEVRPLSHEASDRNTTELLVRDRDRLSQRRPIFAPWRPIGVRQDQKEAPSVDTRLDNGTGVFEGEVPRAYRVFCTSDPGGSADGMRGTVGDPGSPLVREFGTKILREAGINPDPAVRPIAEDSRAVRAIELYLQERFKYSRNLRAPPLDESPVDWFLETAREGHCEYFAGALAALCRSMGINARVVTGYVAGEFDSDRRMYTVRQAGAHAWVEAEVGPGRWRQFDATPAEEVSRLAGSDHGIFLRMERWFAGIETAWNTRVVNFGQESRGRGIGNGEWTRATLRFLQRAEETVRRIGVVPVVTWTLIGLGAASLVFAALGLSITLVVKRVRQRETLGAAVKGEARELYARLLKAWDVLGTPKPAWRGAMEHAGTLSGEARSLGEGVLVVCYREFFAEDSPQAVLLQDAREQVRTLERHASESRRRKK